MDLEHLYLIKDGAQAFAYLHLSFAAITDLTFNVLKSLKEKKTIANIAEQYGLTTAEVQHIVESLEKILDNKNNNTKISESANSKRISRITLHVSNDCNLRCKYCYANGGSYNQKRGLMSIDTATNFVDFCINNFEKIDSVVFFGGEPLLNVPVMELICQLFKKYFKEGISSFIPKFGIITNGTILNDRIFKFINENISYLTVSIDGNKEVNDANRVFANGRGSYEKIVSFIRTLRANTNITINYEATFTQTHLDLKYTHKDVAQWLKSELGINGDITDELSLEERLDDDSNLSVDYNELLKNSFESLPAGFGNILWALVKKTSIQMCGVIKETFAVSVDGDIYPCHIINGEQQNYLGNIQSNNIFTIPSMLSDIPSIFSLKDNKKCKSCWANELCGGCAIKWFYDERSKTFREYPNEELCNQYLKRVEKILIILGRIRKNRELWDAFLEKVYKKTA